MGGQLLSHPELWTPTSPVGLCQAFAEVEDARGPQGPFVPTRWAVVSPGSRHPSGLLRPVPLTTCVLGERGFQFLKREQCQVNALIITVDVSS